MSPVQTNTQQGLVVAPATSDLSTSIGCFANVGTDGNVAVVSQAGGFALYVIENAYASGGIITPPSGVATGAAYWVDLRPLSPDRNVRVLNGTTAIATPGALVTSDASGKLAPASTGSYVLGYTENSYGTTADYPTVAGQYTLIRPLGGIQTKSA